MKEFVDIHYSIDDFISEKSYKGIKNFSEQFRECTKNGILKDIEVDGPLVLPKPFDPNIVITVDNSEKHIELWCSKYNKTCSSNVCNQERLDIWEAEQLNDDRYKKLEELL